MRYHMVVNNGMVLGKTRRTHRDSRGLTFFLSSSFLGFEDPTYSLDQADGAHPISH